MVPIRPPVDAVVPSMSLAQGDRKGGLGHRLFGLLQWVAAFGFLIWKVHWVHAALAMSLALWTRWVAYSLIRSLRGPFREWRSECDVSRIRRLFEAWLSQDPRQSALERILVPLTGLLPVVFLHSKLGSYRSLEAAELVCFGYAFNALVMVHLSSVSDLAENRGMNFASLTYVAHYLSEFSPLAPYAGMMVWIGWVQWIPTGVLHGYLMVCAVESDHPRESGVVWAFVFLALYLSLGLGLASVFVISTKHREQLYLEPSHKAPARKPREALGSRLVADPIDWNRPVRAAPHV